MRGFGDGRLPVQVGGVSTAPMRPVRWHAVRGTSLICSPLKCLLVRGMFSKFKETAWS